MFLLEGGGGLHQEMGFKRQHLIFLQFQLQEYTIFIIFDMLYSRHVLDL